MTRLRLGWPGALGAILILGGVAFLQLVLEPLERRHAALLEEAHQGMHRVGRQNPGLVRVSARQSKLAAFYGFFERSDALTDHLAKLHALARQAGVEPRLAEYRLAESGRLRLAEYSVSIPVVGSYAEVRAFLENALEQIPVLTLDQVSIRRKRVADHLVEAEVRFTVFLSRP
jgi:hypothetical protein